MELTLTDFQIFVLSHGTFGVAWTSSACWLSHKAGRRIAPGGWCLELELQMQRGERDPLMQAPPSSYLCNEATRSRFEPYPHFAVLRLPPQLALL